MNSDVTISIHIPKTGGQTLRKIVMQNYPKESIFTCYPTNPRYSNFQDFVSMEKKERNKYRIFVGHPGFGTHELLEEPFSYFAMMREPVERVLSNYQHIIRNNPSFNGIQVPIAKFYESKRLLLDNFQTRMISGMNPLFGQCDENMYEKALENIEKYFSFVGLNEEFDKSVELLADIYGWQHTEQEKINITPNKMHMEDLEDEDRELIELYNGLDMKLYDEMVKQFSDRWTQHNAPLITIR